MSNALARVADRLLARILPLTEAAADTVYWRFCYCSYGVAYRGKVVYSDGVVWYYGCQPAGAC